MAFVRMQKAYRPLQQPARADARHTCSFTDPTMPLVADNDDFPERKSSDTKGGVSHLQVRPYKSDGESCNEEGRRPLLGVR